MAATEVRASFVSGGPPENQPAKKNLHREVAKHAEQTNERQVPQQQQQQQQQSARRPPVVVSPDCDYPDAKALLVSYKRPRSFLERAARELLAGGTEHIMLSALGDTMVLAIQVQHTLEAKMAARTVKVATILVSGKSRKGGAAVTPGLHIIMEKHPEFKGSRIIPSYTSFCAKQPSGYNPPYEAQPEATWTSLNPGNTSLAVGGEMLNKAFAEVLSACGISCAFFAAMHAAALEKAWEAAGDRPDEEINATVLEGGTTYPEIKVCLCRPCAMLKKFDPTGKVGAVFTSIFRDKFPLSNSKNMAMTYVVPPQPSDFTNKDDFLFCVESTARNFMSAICDYNGFAKRNRQPHMLQRISKCRVALFSDGDYSHIDCCKSEVAAAILKGLDGAYHHGPGPRINFAYDEDVFTRAWKEITGLEPSVPESQPSDVQLSQPTTASSNAAA